MKPPSPVTSPPNTPPVVTPATPPPATTAVRRRTVSGAANKPPGQGSGNSNFENLHARDKNGVFTAGPDQNNGPHPEKTTGLQPGSKGPRVRGLQQLLNSLGYTISAPLQTNGVYDKATADAVRKAQTELGITPDGIFGPKTRAALRLRRDGPPKGSARRSRSRSGRAAGHHTGHASRRRAATTHRTRHSSSAGSTHHATHTAVARTSAAHKPNETPAQLAAQLTALRTSLEGLHLLPDQITMILSMVRREHS